MKVAIAIIGLAAVVTISVKADLNGLVNALSSNGSEANITDDSDDYDYDDVNIDDEIYERSLVSKYAHPGDKCNKNMYKDHMAKFNEAIARQNLTEARDHLDIMTEIVEDLSNETARSQFVMKICFGAALMCNESNKCECLKLQIDKKKFEFVAEKYRKERPICRADEGTFCQPQGFKCRSKHICLENLCTLADSGGGIWRQNELFPVVIALFSWNLIHSRGLWG